MLLSSHTTSDSIAGVPARGGGSSQATLATRRIPLRPSTRCNLRLYLTLSEAILFQLVTPMQVFLDAVGQFTGDAGDTQDPVATFDTVQVLAPRGRFSIELYSSYLKLVGQVRHALFTNAASLLPGDVRDVSWQVFAPLAFITSMRHKSFARVAAKHKPRLLHDALQRVAMLPSILRMLPSSRCHLFFHAEPGLPGTIRRVAAGVRAAQAAQPIHPGGGRP